MKNKTRVALYLRVSTQDQNLDLQSRELLQFVEARGWQLIDIYEDKATGTNDKRPGLQQLLSDARRRKFDLILVWKLDRFARSLRDLVLMLQELGDLGIQFISLKDNVDLTTASGRLMCALIAAFAEFEASLIKERVKAGLAAAKAKGKKIGRPKKDLPLKQIEVLRSQGRSFRSIANELNLGLGTVQRACSNLAR